MSDRTLLDDEEEYKKYREAKYAEIAPSVLELADLIFDAYLGRDEFRILLEAYYGHYKSPDWFDSVFGHFNSGMSVRNLLRKNKLTDDLVPDKNLDDYYIVMLEHWMKVRP